MTFLIRRATGMDAPDIARVKMAVWPEESSDEGHIARVVESPDRVTLVAVDAGEVVGFVDGFTTLSPAGVSRWEVDLLAVRPDHRGRGIGRALILACTAAGRDLGAALARALIQVTNVASQRAFAHGGYQVGETPCGLFVSTDGVARPTPAPDGLHLIPVVTLTYHGLWLEGDLSAAGFAAAQAIRARHGWDVAGAVIALERQEAIRAAEDAGFARVAHFQWWQLTLAEAR